MRVIVIVPDASSAVALLADYPQGRVALVRSRFIGEQLHAPHLLELEVANALRRLVVQGELSADRARNALQDLLELALP